MAARNDQKAPTYEMEAAAWQESETALSLPDGLGLWPVRAREYCHCWHLAFDQMRNVGMWKQRENLFVYFGPVSDPIFRDFERVTTVRSFRTR